MPHAALWVVQHAKMEKYIADNGLFQCRTRLCGWCNDNLAPYAVHFLGFNAARGFVGGATWGMAAAAFAMLFQCRTRLCGWCNFRVSLRTSRLSRFQCRTRLCGWCNLSPAQSLARSAPSTPMSKLESLDGVMRLCGTSPRLSISFSAPSIS